MTPLFSPFYCRQRILKNFCEIPWLDPGFAPAIEVPDTVLSADNTILDCGRFSSGSVRWYFSISLRSASIPVS